MIMTFHFRHNIRAQRVSYMQQQSFQSYFQPMRILERVQAFLPPLTIEIFLFFLLRGKPKKISKFKMVKNGCTNSRVRIDFQQHRLCSRNRYL